ncbi:DUF6868 family protein [Methylovulum psychrotolerans]|uniref:DUF6868 domain-containing protein n=1 Tax=Methylovulum psychrotolerans TaxID=1704499 RepID=A0A1Z4BUI6_9GAMM|nr:hypothetical protein [Methylovulum psychrotolerans]ASF44910.1 hypothetical protein CEK71_01855 [Methylovulum psychrotolerans]
MTGNELATLLGYSAVINYSVLMVWFFCFKCAHAWLYRLHGRWFQLSVGQFDAVHYAGMALYKIGVLLLNITPYLALLLMG